MTQQEILQLLTRLKTNYPSILSSTKWNNDELNALGNEFMYFLKEIPGDEVARAFDEYLLTEGNNYPPKAADLYRIVMKNRLTGKQETAVKAWEEVLKLMGSREFHYHPKNAFEGLPEITKETIGSYRTMKSWSMMNTEELTYIKRDFIRDYKTRSLERRREALEAGKTKKLTGGIS